MTSTRANKKQWKSSTEMFENKVSSGVLASFLLTQECKRVRINCIPFCVLA